MDENGYRLAGELPDFSWTKTDMIYNPLGRETSPLVGKRYSHINFRCFDTF
jgi:hypothetical protein